MAPRNANRKAPAAKTTDTEGHRPVTRASNKAAKTAPNENKVQKQNIAKPKAAAKTASTGKRLKEQSSKSKAKVPNARTTKEEAKPQAADEALKTHNTKRGPQNPSSKTKNTKRGPRKPLLKPGYEIVESESEDGLANPQSSKATKKNEKLKRTEDGAKQLPSEMTKDVEKDQSPPTSPKRKRDAKDKVTEHKDIAQPKKSPRIDEDRKIQSLFDSVRNNRDNFDPDTTYKNHIEDWEHFEDGSSGVFSVLVEDRSREEEDDEPYLFPIMPVTTRSKGLVAAPKPTKKQESAARGRKKKHTTKTKPAEEEAIKDQPIHSQPVKTRPAEEEAIKDQPIQNQPTGNESKKTQPIEIESTKDHLNVATLAADTIAESANHHAYYLDRITVRGHLASEGWDLKPIDIEFCCHRTPPLSQLPSPFADLDNDQLQQFKHIIDSHTLKDVGLLFRQCRDSADTLQASMLNGKSATRSDGQSIRTQSLVIASRAKEKISHNEDSVEPKVHNLPYDKDWLVIEIDPLRPRKRLDPNNAGKSLEIRRVLKPDSKKPAYFLINIDLDFLVINDLPIGRLLIAGPLADFAVITIGHIAAFWWRSARDWNYIPEPRSIKRKRDKDEELSSPAPADWESILSRGLEHFRRLAKGTDASKSSPLNSISNLPMKGITSAIGTMWEALRLGGIYFSFAGLDVFASDEGTRKLLRQSGVVGGGNKFIMPLYIPATKAQENGAKKSNEKGQAVAHYVLGVADLDPKTRAANDISMEVYDSTPGYMTPSRITGVARDTMERSGWLRSPLDKDHMRLNFTQMVQWPEAPSQPKGHTCGFYVILNAWAVMLGIPIHPGRRRRGQHSNNAFETLGREIINLALAGFMDSRTIQAFLNAYGYSEDQSPAQPVKHSVIAVRLRINKFDDIMRREADEPKGREWQASDREVTNEIVYELIGFLPESKSDIPTVTRALEIEHGDNARAVNRIMSPSNEPSPPISPHTPTFPKEQGLAEAETVTQEEDDEEVKGAGEGAENKGAKS